MGKHKVEIELTWDANWADIFLSLECNQLEDGKRKYVSHLQGGLGALLGTGEASPKSARKKMINFFANLFGEKISMELEEGRHILEFKQKNIWASGAVLGALYLYLGQFGFFPAWEQVYQPYDLIATLEIDVNQDTAIVLNLDQDGELTWRTNNWERGEVLGKMLVKKRTKEKWVQGVFLQTAMLLLTFLAVVIIIKQVLGNVAGGMGLILTGVIGADTFYKIFTDMPRLKRKMEMYEILEDDVIS
jgi:hypothetical protein